MSGIAVDGLSCDFWRGRKILITGHTGFKGSWLALLLHKLGADVTGYALSPPTNPNHFGLLDGGLVINSIIGDIRDADRLRQAMAACKPEMVFHLAAQPIVRYSYRNPVDTFETNITGTMNVLEACRAADSVRAIVNVTSDKCYKNRNRVGGYRENDHLGGNDPYSASKACAEIISESYRYSFWNPDNYGRTHNVLLATARAGNVIGGGDWGEDRLIPDIIRAVTGGGKVIVRNPDAVRPWQHVLDPLRGYLMLGRCLIEGKKEFAEAWNFGPSFESGKTVIDIVRACRRFWSEFDYEIDATGGNEQPEQLTLSIDSSKAYSRLGWKPELDIEAAVGKTVEWYKMHHMNMKTITSEQVDEYVWISGL